MKIIFAGGGTGGHLFPALAIADEIRRRVPEAMITFIGANDKIEARVVPQRGYSFEPIWISGFRRTFTLSNLLFPVKVVTSLMQSFFLMKKLKPDAVVGTGGYVCGPPLFVASQMGFPTLIQEQNSYPGITTRRLAKRVNEVHLTFDASKRYLKRLDNVRLSGNPTNSKLRTISRPEALKHFGLDLQRKTLLVFGGSLGATSINNEIARVLPQLLALGLQLIWQTGTGDYDRVSAGAHQTLSAKERERMRIMKFIDRMEIAYSAADLAVCRAGASTLAELAVVGLSSILVPYPFAAADHQTENARAMVQHNAAVMITDSELQQQLVPTITELIGNEEKLKRMSEFARRLGKPEAAATIAEAVLKLAGHT